MAEDKQKNQCDGRNSAGSSQDWDAAEKAERFAHDLSWHVLNHQTDDSVAEALLAAINVNTPKGGGGAQERVATLAHAITGNGIATDPDVDLDDLRNACWQQYQMSPYVQTAIEDRLARMCGPDFAFSSPVSKIQEVIETHVDDFRNRLFARIPMHVRHRLVTGELHLALTVHRDEAFVEVDFIAPENVEDIIFHPGKDRMPLVYIVGVEGGDPVQIPSINLAYLKKIPKKILSAHPKFNWDALKKGGGFNRHHCFRETHYFSRFITEWEGSLIVKRDSSFLRCIIIWNNLYHLMMLTEIDHKRAMAMFAWVAESTDEDAWTRWQNLSPQEKAETGLLKPKKPGSTVVPPFGWKLSATTPQLSAINDSNADIREMVTGGLGTPQDIATGTARGTHASVTASRGPYLSRMLLSQAEHANFLRHDLWKPIFILLQKCHGFPARIGMKEAIGFSPGSDGLATKTPVIKRVMRLPWQKDRLYIHQGGAAIEDLESVTKAGLGTKHAGLNRGMGVAHGDIARRLGISDLHGSRLRGATERIRFPELDTGTDDEATQEKVLEPGKG